MKFGNDKIKFNVSKPVETSNAIHSCFVIDKIKTKGQEGLAPSTKDASRTLNDDGVGVKNKDHAATALKMPKLAVGTMGKNVDNAATSSHSKGKPLIGAYLCDLACLFSCIYVVYS